MLVKIKRLKLKSKSITKNKSKSLNKIIDFVPEHNDELVNFITWEDYQIPFKKLDSRVQFQDWLIDVLEYVIENNIPPIPKIVLQNFIDEWNILSIENLKFVKLKININTSPSSQKLLYMRLALSYRLAHHKIKIKDCIKAAQTFSYLSKIWGKLKYKNKKLDPLTTFLYNNPYGKPWFDICLKPMYEILQQFHPIKTKYKPTQNKICKHFLNIFYTNSYELGMLEIEANYTTFVKVTNEIVSDHITRYFHDMKIDEFLEEYFAFLQQSFSNSTKTFSVSYMLGSSLRLQFYRKMRDQGYSSFGVLYKDLT